MLACCRRLIWLAILPLHMYSTLGYGVIPCTAIIAYMILGIDEIGVDIEEPFGILPLEAICDRAEIDCRSLVKNHLLVRSSMVSFAAESSAANKKVYDNARIQRDYKQFFGKNFKVRFHACAVHLCDCPIWFGCARGSVSNTNTYMNRYPCPYYTRT